MVPGQLAFQVPPLLLISHRLQTDNSHVSADSHEHVGVVDGLAMRVA